jgi:hypothetical protein
MLSSLEHYEKWNLAIRKRTRNASPSLTLLQVRFLFPKIHSAILTASVVQ